MQEGRDFWWDEEAEKVQTYCPCEPVNSEDPLFILYVSVSSDSVFQYHSATRLRATDLSTPSPTGLPARRPPPVGHLPVTRRADSRPLARLVNPKESSTRPLVTSSVPSYR